MLVLTRKWNERIRIGDDICITIVGFPQQGRVRLGIEAPPSMPVHREEVYAAIKRFGKGQNKENP